MRRFAFKKLGRAAVVLLMVLSIAATAVAYNGERLPVQCDCNKSPCICFIQWGDEGIVVKAVVKLLIELNYLDTGHPNQFDDSCEKAVMRFQRDCGLPETGVMDDETLTWLVWGMSTAELDKKRIEGTAYRVWVPTDGGKKYHGKSTCSGMLNPRMISHRNAIAMGIDDCGRCKPNK